ncbi:MAG: peroxiredoxin family protein, partial [Planctomycetota bacterium]
MKKTILTMLLVLTVLVVVFAGCKGKEPEAGKKAPEFTLKSFGGEEISLSEYKGKIVVLEWFNDECPHVKYHHGTVHTMVEVANKYKSK